MTLFRDLIQQTIVDLSMVSGSDVQTYAEDSIAQKLIDAFKLVILEEWWPDYMQWGQYTTDGVTGRSTTDLPINEFHHIAAVYRGNTDDKINLLPSVINPFRIVSSRPLFISADGSVAYRPFVIWPRNVIETVTLHMRVVPDTFDLDDDVKMDGLLLRYGAAWMYSEDDATSPGATGKFQGLFDARLKQLRANLSNLPLSLDYAGNPTNNDWSEP